MCHGIGKTKRPHSLNGPWIDIARTLDKQEKEEAARGTSSNVQSGSSVREEVEYCIKKLQDWGYKDIDVDTALLAMRTYARRNYICHGETRQMIEAKDFRAAAKILKHDNEHLDELLPEDEKHLADKYRAILSFYWRWYTYNNRAMELTLVKPSQPVKSITYKSRGSKKPLTDLHAGKGKPAASTRQRVSSQTPSRKSSGSTKRPASEQAEEPPSKRRKSGKTKMATGTSKQQGGRRFKRPTKARRSKSP